MTDPELPMFATEVRFYREVLAISWEFGSHLRRRGALIPDAVLDDGRALFLLTAEKLGSARNQVFLHKARRLEAANPLEATPDVEIATL